MSSIEELTKALNDAALTLPNRVVAAKFQRARSLQRSDVALAHEARS